MASSAIAVDTSLTSHDGRLVATIRCGDDVDVNEMQRVVGSLDERAQSAALVAHDATADEIGDLVQRRPPVARPVAVTDALKLVADDLIAGTVDRSRFVRAGLPMLLDINDLRRKLATMEPGVVPVGALLAPAARVTFLPPATGSDDG